MEIRDYMIPDLIWLDCSSFDWRSILAFALDRSRAILFIPGVSNGMKEELDLIQTRRLTSKILVIMPPAPRGPAKSEKRGWASGLRCLDWVSSSGGLPRGSYEQLKTELSWKWNRVSSS